MIENLHTLSCGGNPNSQRRTCEHHTERLLGNTDLVPDLVPGPNACLWSPMNVFRVDAAHGPWRLVSLHMCTCDDAVVYSRGINVNRELCVLPGHVDLDVITCVCN